MSISRRSTQEQEQEQDHRRVILDANHRWRTAPQSDRPFRGVPNTQAIDVGYQLTDIGPRNESAVEGI